MGTTVGKTLIVYERQTSSIPQIFLRAGFTALLSYREQGLPELVLQF